MDKEKINKIIEFLEYVMKRPQLYVGKDDDFEAALHFLIGVRHGILTLLDSDRTIISSWHDAIIKRGHRLRPLNTIPEDMKKNGFEDTDIVKEYIEIEIETWKIFRDSLEK